MDPNNFKSGTLWTDPVHPTYKPFMVWYTHEHPDDTVSSEMEMEIVTDGWCHIGGYSDSDRDICYWTKYDGWDNDKMRKWEPVEPEPDPKPAKRWGVIDLDWLDKVVGDLKKLEGGGGLYEFGVGRLDAYEEILEGAVEL